MNTTNKRTALGPATTHSTSYLYVRNALSIILGLRDNAVQTKIVHVKRSIEKPLIRPAI